ncbi:MAG: GTPase [Chloroflexia bacterium]|jgi:GTP-binding protein|nr:GTPase [Chloroflexia bacterium]
MFYDQAKIFIKAGNGGDGSASFRREKFVPKGGPDGGDGGRGGSVYLRVSPDLNSLLPFHYKQHFKAQHGGAGSSNQKHGKAAQDLYIDVPPGTTVEVMDESPISGAAAEVLEEDLLKPGQTMLVARGGRGGLGNVHFTTSTHQAPRYAEKGEPGEERTLVLELRLISDVGLLGYPNVGKSTLLSVVSAAQPKIGDYPFTTLAPMLGVVEVDGDTFVLADIPGLIEGASQGTGLGLEFLRHVQRTRLLLHVVDGSAGLWDAYMAPAQDGANSDDRGDAHPSQTTDPIADFKRINAELEQYDPDLAERPQIVAINKTDIPEVQERLPQLMSQFKDMGYDAYPISAATGQGVQDLLRAVAAKLKELPKPEWAEEEAAEGEEGEEEEKVVRPQYRAAESRQFEVMPDGKGRYRVAGHRIERLITSTDMSNPFSLERLQRELAKMGVSEALSAAGVEPGDTVTIGRVELEWSDEPWVSFERNTSRRKRREGPGKQRS